MTHLTTNILRGSRIFGFLIDIVEPDIRLPDIDFRLCSFLSSISELFKVHVELVTAEANSFNRSSEAVSKSTAEIL